MTRPLKFKRAQKQDIPVLDEFNTVGESAWLYEFWPDNGQEGILYTALDEAERMVGIEGYVKYPMLSPQGEITTHRSERTLVCPSQRGKGVFASLVEKCDVDALREGSEFCWGSTSALRPFSKAGFTPCTGWRTYLFFSATPKLSKTFLTTLRSIKVTKLMKRARRDRSYTLKAQLLSAASVFLPKPHLSKGWVANPVLAAEVEATNLASQAANRAGIVLPITSGLDLWLSSKGIQNRYLLLQFQNEVVGYAAYTLTAYADSPKISEITDFYLAPGHRAPDALGCIIDYLSNCENVASAYLALNAANELHREYLSEIPLSMALRLRNRGSFVLKGLKNAQIQMKDLLVTGTWFQL